MYLLHCSAIALAIPTNVFEASLAFLVTPLECFCPRFAPPVFDGRYGLYSDSILVGIIGGRFFSQSSVFLLKGSPCSYGCTTQSGVGSCTIFSGTGFSTAMCLHFALRNLKKNSFASRASFNLSSLSTPAFRYIHLAPALLIYVHGGCAISKSHSPSCACFLPSSVRNTQCPFIKDKQSPLTCHSGCPPLHSCKSHEKALCPNSRKALHTI